jgi:hypothetical protein
MTERNTPFEVLVQMTVEVLPEIAQDLRRNISNIKLLRVAAKEALRRYPREQVLALLSNLMACHDEAVDVELATLLLSLFEIDNETRLDYLKERGGLHGLEYRFEGGIEYRRPEWLYNGNTPRDYVSAIVAEAVARYLTAVGGWERPARLVQQRRQQAG